MLNLISRTQFIFTMFKDLKCLQVKILVICTLGLAHEKFNWFNEMMSVYMQNSHVGPLDINSWVPPKLDMSNVYLFIYLIERIRLGT